MIALNLKNENQSLSMLLRVILHGATLIHTFQFNESFTKTRIRFNRRKREMILVCDVKKEKSYFNAIHLIRLQTTIFRNVV